MTKKIFLGVLLSFFLFSNHFSPATAQDTQQKTEKKSSKFGSLLKKVGEKTTGINMTDEQFIVNPLSSKFNIEIVDCIGNSAEQKFELTLKITNKSTNESNLCIGGNCNGSSAVDKDGNSYKPDRCAGDCKDFPTNVPVKVKILFEKVLPTVTDMEVIKLTVGYKGTVELRNVKINWDAVPAEIAVNTESKEASLVNSLSSKYEIVLVGCEGDAATQHVTIALKIKNKSTNEKICVGGNCSGNSMAIDADGESYKTESCAGDCKDLPTGVFVKAVVGFNQILTSVKTFDYVKLSVGNGAIEIKNLPIEWK